MGLSLVTSNSSSISRAYGLGLYSEIKDELDYSSILSHIAYFASLGSRVTGYAGCDVAALHVQEVFRDYGLEVVVQNYNVTVPVELDARITITSPSKKTLKAYGLWPNLIQTSATPEQGLDGRLIYVGDGELSDFNGKKVEGSIVLMDFNTGQNWINAAKLGAKAIIFIEPTETNRYQSEAKFLRTPISFPRLYVNAEDAQVLMDELAQHKNVTVNILLRMFYRTVTAKNIIGIINGTSSPNDVIVVSAHYDSWSIVPSLSPAADEGTSISSLLEIAKYFAKNRPLRTLWLVALPGHWEALAGAREFVETNLFSPSIQEGKTKIWMHIGLDFSTSGKGVDLLFAGHGYNLGKNSYAMNLIVPRMDWIRATIFQRILPEIDKASPIKFSDLVYDGFRVDGWRGTTPLPYMLDTEPSVIAGTPAFSIRTSIDMRLRWSTPLSDLPYIDISNLKPQLLFSTFLISSFLNSETWGMIWDRVVARRVSITASAQTSGFITLQGNVLTYDVNRAWYTRFPNALVRVTIPTDSNYIPFANIITYADGNGSFTIHGLAPSVLLPAAYFIDAWVINETDGRIVYAPDLGIYGAKSISQYLSPWKHPEYVETAIFKCVNIVLYDIIDPKTLRTGQILDPRVGTPFYSGAADILVFDFRTLSEPLFYGYLYVPSEKAAMVFGPPGMTFAICLGFGVPRSLLGFLVNASSEHPEGLGFKVKEGETLSLTFTAYHFLRDMYFVSDHRYNNLRSRLVRKMGAERSLLCAQQDLLKCEEYYRSQEYDKFYEKALHGWSSASSAYSNHVMPLFYDLGGTTIIYLSLLVPFTIFFERLIFHRDGRKRFLSTTISAALMAIALFFIHPALQIMTNSILAVLAIIMEVFLILVLFVFLSKSSVMMEEEAVTRTGMHRISTGSLATAITFLPSVAVENLRRRKFRTTLVLISVMMFSVALTSLTSTSSDLTIKMGRLNYPATYNGILIKRARALPPAILGKDLPLYLNGIFEGKAEISPRIWYYPESVYPEGAATRIGYSSRETLIRGILGTTSSESKRLFLTEGRPFELFDYYACILPVSISKTLNITAGEYVQWRGVRLLVAGIFDDASAAYDLDGLSVAPLNPIDSPILNLFAAAGVSRAQPNPLPWSLTLIVPYKLALDLGGYVASVSVTITQGADLNFLIQAAENITTNLDLPVYVGWEGVTYGFSRVMSWFVIGWESLVVVAIIILANVMVTMLGAVKERTRDIFVYSTSGLSPKATAIMFLTESGIYGVLAAIIGFILGFAINAILLTANLLPTNFVLNYSSFSVAFSVVVVILVVLVSTVYPISVASKITTPSLQRRWKVPTKPKGTRWEVPMPLTLDSQEETHGVLAFIWEYLDGRGRLTSSSRVRHLEPLSAGALQVEAVIDLAPFEINLTQRVILSGYLQAKKFSLTVKMELLTGPGTFWRSSNYNFLDDLRKQLLLWRSLTPDVRQKYIARTL